MDLQKEVLKYKNDVVTDISQAVQIKSVMEEAKLGMPFGEGPAKALAYFMDLGKKLGFTVVNYDNYACEIEFGDGEETLAILGHVDVVPEGENWTYPPYAGEIIDGRIYGRGTLDDKGPSVICLYAMKTIMDSKLPLKRKVRMILGANEESGSKCLKHYFGVLKRPQPTLAFTPDSSFPVTFAEKGIIRIVLKQDFHTFRGIKIVGGNAFNSVPEKATMTVCKDIVGPMDPNVDMFNAMSDYKVEAKLVGDNYEITAYGKSAHGSTPAKGHNAIYTLFAFLKMLDINNREFNNFEEWFDKYFGVEINGHSLGIDFKDSESGETSVNLGKILVDDGEVELSLDIRVPVTIPNEKVIETVEKTLENSANVNVVSNSKALYVPKDSFLVSTLMNIYKDATGDTEAQPVAIGGGTYARQVDNGVAFGALLSSQVNNMHQRDEYLEIDKIDTLLDIYVKAIYELAK